MLGCSHLHHKRESLSLGGLRFATPRGRGMLGSASFGLVHCVVCELFLARMCLQADPFLFRSILCCRSVGMVGVRAFLSTVRYFKRRGCRVQTRSLGNEAMNRDELFRCRPGQDPDAVTNSTLTDLHA